jgi:hypothetical protein
MPKKTYYLVLDVETANSTEDALVYDLGYAIVDRCGNVYEAESFVVSDIFYDEAQLMQTAYYAEKIPKYVEGIRDRAFKVRTFYQVRRLLADAMERWGCKIVAAYNANFDVTALNTTERWLTKSKYRYFLPYGTEVFCIWHMACQVICTQTGYIKFCLQNGFVSPSGNIKTSAEAVYAFLTQDAKYTECHTGLQDVFIEAKIMRECFRKHKKMSKEINRFCWRIPQKKAKTIQKELG